MVYPLLAPLLRSMGAGGAALGALEAVSEGVSAVIKWRSGAWADRGDRKRLVVIGYAIAALARPIIGFAVAPWQVIALRSTDRVGKGVRSAPRDAMLASAVDPRHRARAFGFHKMMDNAGAVLGPLMAFSLAQFLSWTPRDIIKFSIVPGVLAVAMLVFGVKDTAAPSKTGANSSIADKSSIDTGAKRYLAALFVFTLGASADSFLLLQLSKLGLATALIPIAWLSLNGVKALTNIPGGRVSDRFGHKRTLVVAWTLYAAVYALFPWMTSWVSAWALMLVYGMYYGLSEGGEKALVVELVPADQRGRALGAMHALVGVATVIANIGFGLLFDLSARTAFWASATFAMLGAVMLAVTVPVTARRDA